MTQTLEPNSQHSLPSGQPAAIRPANVADVPAILSLEQTASSAAHWNADHYQRRIQSQPQSACLLVADSFDAVNKARLSGFLCALIVAGDWEIENVVVHPMCRRQ